MIIPMNVTRLLAAAAWFACSTFAAAPARCETAVLTHHNDYYRSGWNNTETILTPAAFSAAGKKFGVLATVSNLDDVVDAQPLVAPKVQINCLPNQAIVTCQTGLSGVYDVVFVATVANTIYAINADNGQILLKRNFGAQADCSGGIKSTPVIDPATGRLYLITHTVDGDNIQSHTLHALDVGTLTDAIAPYKITAANTNQTLQNGAIYGFDSAIMCQRSALLLVGGEIYAGFRAQESAAGSIETITAVGRGWLLGWNAATLAPLAPLLTNGQATSAKTSSWRRSGCRAPASRLTGPTFFS